MPFLRYCLLLFLAGCVCQPAAAFPPLRALDRHGDPLPAGAVGRLGTTHLRANCSSLHFSADGRTLVGTDGKLLRVWDAANGRLLEVRRLPGEEPVRSVRSADGRTLFLTHDTAPERMAGELWDVPTGERLDLHVPRDRKRIERIAVSNDRRSVLFEEIVGERPAALRGGFNQTERVVHLVLWDNSTGTARNLSEDETNIVTLAFSPNGNLVVSSGGQGTRVWDTNSGKLVSSIANYNAERAQFTPDGKYLIAAPGGGQHEWHVWETATGKPAPGLHPPTVGYAWTFAISPNGNDLLIPTDTEYVVWDLKAGSARHRWPGTRYGRGAFAPDGRSVVTHDTIFHRRDLANGKDQYSDVTSIGHTAAIRRLFFTPDGTRVVSVGYDTTARIWDAATTRLLRTIAVEPGIEAWALTPDGSELVAVDNKLLVRRWPIDVAGPVATADLRDAQKLDIGLQPREIRITPDGVLALLAWPRSPEYRFLPFTFSFWDPATGRLLRWGGDPGREFHGDASRLAPDGRTAAGTEAAYDTRTGTRHILPASPFGLGSTPLFSPDGRLLAATARDTRVWELATGRVLVDLPNTAIDRAAFSRDGRRLAAALPDRLVVWDLPSRKPLVEWPVPRSHPLQMYWVLGEPVFSPDGRTLATGHMDGTILLWSVPPPIPDGRWSDSDASSAWDALADDTPINAYSALWQLADYPNEAVRFFRGNVALGPAAGADEWTKLIASLDSPRFAEREAASKRLRELGRAAEGPLRQALKRGPSPEQVARIETLLAGLEPSARPRGSDLRAIRAVAVLEYIGTDDARSLLAAWAERGSPPRLADEAARALERLTSRRQTSAQK